LFPEILEAIAEESGWQIRYVFGNWVQCLDRLEKGKIDVMVDVGFSPKRAKRFTFNEESILVNWGIVYTKSGHPVETFLDLQGKKIAVMQGSIHTDGDNGIKNLLRRFNVSAQLVEVENYTKVFDLLEKEDVEAGVVNRIFGSLFAEDYDLQRSSILFNPSQLRFAFPTHSPLKNELIATIDQSIRELKNHPDSIYYRAIEAYLSGQPGEAIRKREGRPSEPSITLTSKEKEWIAAHPEIRLGVDPEFIPFEYLSDNRVYSGIASDYIKILNQRLGINFKVVKGLSWKQVIEKARHHEIDLLPCVGKTLERLQYLKYSRSYLKFQRVIITRSDFPFITGLADIKPYKTGAQVDSSHHGFLVENTDIAPIGFNTLQDALLAVSTGEIDAFIGNAASSTYWIRSLNLTNLRIAATVPPDVLNLYFAVRNDWPELVGIINKGLHSISEVEKNRIYQKWISVEYREGIDPKLVWKYILWAALVILMVLLAFLLWNVFLKQEIARRKVAEAKLQNNSQLEHLVSEISSSFVSLSNEELDTYIENAMGIIASFIGADLAGVFSLENNEKKIICTHHWLEKGFPDAFLDRFETDVEKLPWWYNQLKKGEVFNVSSLDDLPVESVNLNAFIGDTGLQSFLDVSLIYQDRMIGFLRMGSIKESRKWTEEEIGVLKLIGQIITNSKQRAKAEQELMDHSNELQAANIRLQELDQLKSMFIASMSHELRTPLNSIIGFTGIILKGMAGEINDQQKDQLQRVYKSAKHLLSLITDVIDISKIEAGRIDTYPETFMISQVVREAFDSLSALAEAKNLKMEMQIADDINMFQDRRRTLQCVINYLSNAVKYTEQGKITLSVQQVGDLLEILVKDTGIGIEPVDVSKLFEPFERLDSHLRIRAGGAGLGLYLTRKIVRELLRGDIVIESEIGVGSTFGLRIPCRLAENTAQQTSQAS
jgi:signal transduction histidine kinase/ABC-type amino acid transport substrate-binding protein